MKNIAPLFAQCGHRPASAGLRLAQVAGPIRPPARPIPIHTSIDIAENCSPGIYAASTCVNRPAFHPLIRLLEYHRTSDRLISYPLVHCDDRTVGVLQNRTDRSFAPAQTLNQS